MIPQLEAVMEALDELRAVQPDAILEFAALLEGMDDVVTRFGEVIGDIGAMARENLSVDEAVEDDMEQVGGALAALGEEFNGLSATFEEVHKEQLDFLREDPNAIKWSPQANADHM